MATGGEMGEGADPGFGRAPCGGEYEGWVDGARVEKDPNGRRVGRDRGW